MRAHVLLVAAATTCAVLAAATSTFENVTSQAVLRLSLGQPCASSWECSMYVAYSDCIHGACACAEGHPQQGQDCMVRTNEECPATHIPSPLCADPHASCVREPVVYPSGWVGSAHHCRCDAGFLHDAQADQCRPAVGQPCIDDIPCIVGACNANTGLCACGGFYVPSADGLSCLSGLGAMCVVVDCADANAQCLNSICVCAEDFQASTKAGDTRPVCRKRLGADCLQDADCAAEGAHCASKNLRAQAGGGGGSNCVCGDNQVPSAGYDDCLDVQGVYGGACAVSQQCTAWLGRRAACVESVCTCAAGHQYDWRSSACVRQ